MNNYSYKPVGKKTKTTQNHKRYLSKSVPETASGVTKKKTKPQLQQRTS